MKRHTPKRRQPKARLTSGVRSWSMQGLVAVAGLVSFGVAVAEITWTALAYGWSLSLYGMMAVRDYDYREAVFTVLLFSVLISLAKGYVFWTFGRLLDRVAHFRGADRYLLLLVACFAVDIGFLLLRMDLEVVSTDPLLGLSMHELPILPSRFRLSYASLTFWIQGMFLIALGCSLLRLPGEVLGGLRLYAYSQIATGIAYAASLGPLALVPSVAGHVLLGLILLHAGGAVSNPAEAIVNGALTRLLAYAKVER